MFQISAYHSTFRLHEIDEGNSMNRFWQMAITLAAAIAPLSCSGADNPPDPATLLKKLTTDDFDERAAAERQLEAIGESARPVLELALKNDDAEVREAALRLL